MCAEKGERLVGVNALTLAELLGGSLERSVKARTIFVIEIITLIGSHDVSRLVCREPSS